MAMTLNEISAIEKRIQGAREERARAQGVLDQAMGKLKSEYGLESLEDAEKRITVLSEKAKTLGERQDVLASDIRTTLAELGY